MTKTSAISHTQTRRDVNTACTQEGKAAFYCWRVKGVIPNDGLQIDIYLLTYLLTYAVKLLHRNKPIVYLADKRCK